MIATERPTLSLAELDAYDRHPSGAGDERRYCCPLGPCRDKPRDRGHQSLNVNVESGAWICHRCTATGKLAERWEERPVQAIRRERALRAFVLPPERPPGRAASAPSLPGLVRRCVPVADTPGEGYLNGRGIGTDTATAARVAWCPDVYGRPAVVFGMKDDKGRLVAVNARHTDGRTDPKTHSCGDRSLGVFATPGALQRERPLVVVEGPCDALALAECDVPAVALVATRAPHWLRTAAAFRRVFVGLDADTEGDEKAAALVGELAPFATGVDRLRPPGGVKDWNDALLADYPGLCGYLEERVR